MPKISTAMRRGLIYITALVLLAGHPVVVLASTEETTEAPAATVAPEENTTEEEEPPLTYTYDPATKKWNSEKWQFDPESGTYEKPPAPVIIEPSKTDTSGGTETEGTKQSVDKTIDTTVTANNDIDSNATSGDASVAGNLNAGDATTGDASAVVNAMNIVNSTITTGKNQKIATFTKDVMGDVEGDIVLYPMLLKAMLEAKANGESAQTINAKTDLGVNNDINVSAKSGNAAVEGNTNAGDATTGNATAMANVVNILNSMIATQDSFIGTINIYGSLDGDILIAPDFIPQMIANNGGSTDSSAQLSKHDTTTIINNISAVADSGAASVLGNTKAGDATTGSADTEVVIFNVTGHDIVAENSMLVFVNVLGKWVGMIVDAPEGATAAMIGSGVTKNQAYAPDLTVESESHHGITNTIAVTAETGDATVANNTTAGNATSGDARAMANIANVSGSQMSLTGWFGLLFINITGDWFGSFQIDTPFGSPIANVTQPSPKPQPSGPVQFIPREERPRQTQAASPTYVLVDSRTAVQNAAPATTPAAASTQTNTSEEASEVKGAMDGESVDETPSEVAPRNLRPLAVLGSIVFLAASLLWIRRAI